MILTFGIKVTDAAGNVSQGQVRAELGPDHQLVFSVELPQASYTLEVDRLGLEMLSNMLRRE